MALKKTRDRQQEGHVCQEGGNGEKCALVATVHQARQTEIRSDNQALAAY